MIKILGIESSCDDTAASVITGNREILSNIIISQNLEHAIFQGVVPEIAARSHLANLERAMKQALLESNTELTEITAIAATSGPGLIGGVIVGSMFARSLSAVLNKPFIAINHLEGHALTARLTDNIPYPYLLLLASGGHCQFVAVLGLGKYKILGATIDDAVGEAFDKVAKMLGLPFPGGPEIEKRAKLGNPHKYTFPKPIINSGDCNMSFSGLKTAVRTLIMNLQEINDTVINDISASFQFTIGEILSSKILNAIKSYEQIIDNRNKNIVIAGGVAANKYLQEILSNCTTAHGYKLIYPPTRLCTDNAAMIAYVGLERYNSGLFTPLNFCPKARWSLEEI
ncbi:MAG TPA: tRNA (adenosine(37)-N6)-threonylcarbamoyltransferase complex transferase subunit TsaD [Rickettsia endosymbiont of Pyrocoelia pectoralis]|nr:tRNA (adenosine(37)-N6)-threonylcarbamoyltransferase complex transferase subunit TsaD [Rickettsia endosymbiont of Pyrocoelia pectoralis]